MNVVDNLNSVKVINKPCVCARTMRLSPLAALRRDRNSCYCQLLFFRYLYFFFTDTEKYLSQLGESTQNLFNLITILNYFHFLTQENIGFKLSEIIVGSGIRDPEKTYSGSRIQGSKRYRIPDPGSGSATLPLEMAFVVGCSLEGQKGKKLIGRPEGRHRTNKLDFL